MRALLAALVLIAVFAFDAGKSAQAQWCAFYDPYTYTCGFRSFEQCLATISGVGGDCRRDPFAGRASDGRRDPERRRPRYRERERW